MTSNDKTNKQTNKPIQQQLIMHPTPFQLCWRHIKTNITNNSGNYNITDLSLYKDRMMKDCFVNSYTTRGTSKECPQGRSAIWVHALRGGNMWCRQWLSTLLYANNLLSTSDIMSSKLYCLSVNFHLYAFRNDASIRSFSAWLVYPPQTRQTTQHLNQYNCIIYNANTFISKALLRRLT